MKPCSVKEGFFKKSNRCKTNYYKNVHKVKNSINSNWYWIYYAIPIILSIALFFILPTREEYIALILLGVTLLVGALIGLYILIKNLFFKPCPNSNCDFMEKQEDSSEIVLVETAKDNKIPESEIVKAEKIEALFKCPGQKPFNPLKEPPGSGLIAGFDYNECIQNGFSVEFCTTTPLTTMGPGSCMCDDGKLGFRNPKNIADCECL